MKLKLFSVLFFLGACGSFLSAKPTDKTTAPTLACGKPLDFTGGIYSNDTIVYFKWALSAGSSTKVVLTILAKDGSYKQVDTITSNTFIKFNLPRCKKIFAYLQVLCDNQLSDSLSLNFETTGCISPPNCQTPENIFASTQTIYKDSMRLWWVGNAAKYYVEYRLVSDSTATAWKRDSSTSASILLKNLNPCSTYAVRITGVCLGGFTTASEMTYFKTFCTTPPVCPKPTALKVVGTDGSAILTWQAPSGDSVNIMILSTDTVFKKTFTVSGSTYTYSGLPRCKHFIAYMQTQCSLTSVSGYGEPVSFETSGCVTPPCAGVQHVGASVVDVNNNILVQWTGNAPKYYVEYRLLSDSLSGVWRRDSTTQSHLTLTGLQSCTYFVVRVIAVCPNGVIAPSPITYFKTQGCVANTCHRPIAFKGAAQDTIAYFAWITELNEINAVLTVVSTDSTYKKTISVTGNNYTLTGLPRCKKFVAHIQTKCPTGVLSDALEFAFSTGGCTVSCGTPATLGVVSSDSTNASLKWTNVGAVKYYIEYKTDSSAVWKRDSTTTTTFTLKNLARCHLYLARVLAVCANGISEPSNTVHFITTGCVITSCRVPAELDADIAHDSTVNLMWTGADSGNYQIQYRVATDPNITWITIKSFHSNYFLTGLKRCQIYEWQVRRICGTDTTAWSAPNKFATLGCNPGVGSAVCPKLQEIAVKLVADTAVVYWASFSPRPFTNYQMQYRKAIDPAWSAVVNLTLPYYIFRNLTACTNYVVRVRVECDSTGNSFGDWSQVLFKEAGINCLRGDNSGFASTTSGIQASVSPNPGSENPTVAFKLGQQTPVRVDVININGSLVGQWNAGTLQAGDYSHTFEQLDILPAGLYIVALRIDGAATQTIKWLKN